jgi:hypothetical protein
MGRRLAALAVAAGALAGASAASALTPAQIVTKLNAQRVANGIPGGIVLDQSGTRDCEHHLRYEELNGIGSTHTEEQGRPGYTKDGERAAAQADQADTHGWANGNPYENLPLHLANLLAPRLARVGAAESGRRTCVTVSTGYTREFAADGVETFPGDGRRGVPASQVVVDEVPFSPGDLVGLRQGTRTGPTILVFASGKNTGAAFVEQARLTGPRGRVALRIVDPGRRSAIAPYIATGTAFLIPVTPLAHRTTYRASVVLKLQDGATLHKSWRFTTR